MLIDYQKVQATRQRTLFPLSGRDLCEYRARVCGILKRAGFSIPEIRQIMNQTPDKVRSYLAKAERF